MHLLQWVCMLPPLMLKELSNGMMIALNITAESIALSGLCKFIMFNPCNAGIATINKAGMMAKYFATSFAILNVVNVPLVMSNCFPISTISISLVGSLSKVHHIACFLCCLCSTVHRYTNICLCQSRGIICTITHHRH
jgi:hypothetical protein